MEIDNNMEECRKTRYTCRQWLTAALIFGALVLLIGMAALYQFHFRPDRYMTDEILNREIQQAADYRFCHIWKENGENGEVRINNETAGYQISMSPEMAETLEANRFCCQFRSGPMTMQVFHESLSSYDELNDYLVYSNKFLKNAEEYTEVGEEDVSYNNRRIRKTIWKKPELNRVAYDTPYYCLVDIADYYETAKEKDAPVSLYEVYTLFFKSAEPIDQEMVDTMISSVKWLSAGTENPAAGGGDAASDQNGSADADDSGNPKTREREFWSDETRAVYQKYFGGEQNLSWGFFEGFFKPDTPNDHSIIEELEEKTGDTIDIHLYYTNFMKIGVNHMLSRRIHNAARRGEILELTIQTLEQDDEGNMVYDILRGDYDVYLTELADLIRDTEKPVLLRLCNEMNGDWCVYSAFHTSRDTQIYIDLYRYVYQVFSERGALPYTIWIWNPNERSFPDFNWNQEFMYYPGDDYVDVIGITGYNTGSYYEGETWRSFREIYLPLYASAAKNYSQPMMITEFASSSTGGNKVRWIRDMFDILPYFKRLKVAVWWNYRDYDTEKGQIARPYWINETPATMNAFVTGYCRQRGLSNPGKD